MDEEKTSLGQAFDVLSPGRLFLMGLLRNGISREALGSTISSGASHSPKVPNM
jgi:hypothetical protein